MRIKYKKTFITAAILLLFLWATELHSLLYKLIPVTMNKPIDSFLQPGYHRKDISFEWHIKTFFDDFFIIVTFFIAGMYLKKVNARLSLVFKLLSIYFMIDLFLFEWNYKSSPGSFYSLMGITTLIMILILIPVKKLEKYGSVIDIDRNAIDN